MGCKRLTRNGAQAVPQSPEPVAVRGRSRCDYRGYLTFIAAPSRRNSSPVGRIRQVSSAPEQSTGNRVKALGPRSRSAVRGEEPFWGTRRTSDPEGACVRLTATFFLSNSTTAGEVVNRLTWIRLPTLLSQAPSNDCVASASSALAKTSRWPPARRTTAL